MPGEAHYAITYGIDILKKPGRYFIFCAVSVGADPAEVRKQVVRGAPGRVEGVPVHYEVGMIAEFTVEG